MQCDNYIWVVTSLKPFFFLKKKGKYYIHDEYLEHEEKPRECRPNMYITALVTSEALNLYHRHLSKSN